MSKDPAFLFYSKDFYEGTRLMLPEERACYVDLLIYQHQHKYIPTDLKRVVMYCSGIDEATLKATLEAKFKLCDKGYYNERLQVTIEQRAEYSSNQSSNGKVGQVMKQVKSMCKPKELLIFKDYFYNVIGKENALKQLESKEATLEALLKASLKHLVNVNEDVNEDVNKNSIPEFLEFKDYALENKKDICLDSLKLKYDSWKENDWKNGNGKQIKNWKSTLLNTLPYIKEKGNKTNETFKISNIQI